MLPPEPLPPSPPWLGSTCTIPCHAHYLRCWYGTCGWSSFRTQRPRWPERGRKDKRGKREQNTVKPQDKQAEKVLAHTWPVWSGAATALRMPTSVRGSRSTPLGSGMFLQKTVHLGLGRLFQHTLILPLVQDPHLRGGSRHSQPTALRC